MKVTILLLALVGVAAADTKYITYSYARPAFVRYSTFPALSYAKHATVAAAAPAAIQYSAPAVQYSAPPVQYTAPALQYTAPALQYSAPAHYVTLKKVDFDDDDDDYRGPLTYSVRDSSLEESDDLVVTPYGIFDDDHFDHDDRK